MSVTLREKHKIDGTLANYTSLKLSDPTGTYGVRRQDTQAIVVVDGTDYVHDSTGVYHYTIDGLVSMEVLLTLVPGVTYEYYRERVYNGETKYDPFTFTVPDNTAEGVYADMGDIENIFGANNVRIWSNLENDTADVDAARVQLALDFADAEINRQLAATYETPMTLTGDDVTTVTDWAARLAGLWLYAARKHEKQDENHDTYVDMKGEVYASLGAYRVAMPGCSLSATRIDTSGGNIKLVTVTDVQKSTLTDQGVFFWPW